MGRDFTISHMLFIDDILLLCNVTIRDASKLREITDLYYMETCMVVNMDKSTISFMRVD